MAKKKKGPMTPRQQKVRKVLSIIANVIGVIVVVVTLLISVMTITRTQRGDTEKDAGLSSIFGFAFMPVLSDSMEPTFKAGDLIVSKLYDGDGSDLKEGDIITFKFYVETVPTYNTHRIYEKHEIYHIDSDTLEKVIDGYWFITQGDNNPDENGDGEPDVDYITRTPNEIVATYTGVRMGGVGEFILRLQTDSNFYFLAVVTPLIVLFVIYVFFFIRAIVQAKLQQTREEALVAATDAPKVSLDELSDEEKLQLLLELQAKKSAESSLKVEDDALSNSDKEVVPVAQKAEPKPKAKTAKPKTPEKAESADTDESNDAKPVAKKPTPKKTPEKAESADTDESKDTKPVAKKPTPKKTPEKAESADTDESKDAKPVAKKPTPKKTTTKKTE